MRASIAFLSSLGLANMFFSRLLDLRPPSVAASPAAWDEVSGDLSTPRSEAVAMSALVSGNLAFEPSS